MTFATGESSTQVSPYLPGGVSDGSWHTVHIHYYNKVRKCTDDMYNGNMAMMQDNFFPHPGSYGNLFV